jgi:hypothetical protein
VRSATGAHNQELVGAPDQGAGSGGPPETKSLAVGRPLGQSNSHGCGFQDFPLFGLSAYKQRFYFDFSPSLVGVGNCRNEIQISTLWTKNLYANGTGKNMASRWNIAFEI